MSEVHSCDRPNQADGTEPSGELTQSIIDAVIDAETDVVLFVVGNDSYATGVGVTSDNKHLHITARTLGFNRSSGTFRNRNAWQAADRCVQRLSADKNYELASPEKRLTCIYVRRGEVKTFYVARDHLPECVRETLSMLPGGEQAGRLVSQITVSSSRRVEGLNGVPSELIRDSNSKQIAVIDRNGKIAIFKLTSEGLKSQHSLQSLFRPDLYRRAILRARFNKSDITVLWRERDNDGIAKFVVESVPIDGRMNSVHSPAPDGHVFAWSNADQNGNLFAVDQSGTAYQMLKEKGHSLERIEGIPDSVQSCVVSALADRAVVLDPDGNAYLWNTDSGSRVVRIGQSCEKCSVEFSPNGRLVAVEIGIRTEDGERTKKIVVVDCESGRNLRQLRPYDVANSKQVHHVNWTSDSRFIFAAAVRHSGRFPNVIHLWTPDTGSHVADLLVNNSVLRVVESEQTGNAVWGLTAEGRLVSWDLEKVLIRPDGRLNATAK